MNTNNKIRWAILGAGRIANAFAKDFPFMQNAELVAVASGNPEKQAILRNNIIFQKH